METIEIYMPELKGEDNLSSLQAVEKQAITTAQAMALLEDRLLVLRLSFGKLKAAMTRAMAPVANLVLPVVNRAVYALTRLMNDLSGITAALFGGAQASDAMAAAQRKLAATTRKTARSLAAFDRLDRLAGTAGSDQRTGKATYPMRQWAQDTVDTVNRLLTPLKQIDFTNLKTAIGELKQAFQPINRELFAGLEWAWTQLLVPLAKWTIEAAAPAAVNTLTQALQILGTVLSPLSQGVREFTGALSPIAQGIGVALVWALQQITLQLQGVQAAAGAMTKNLQQTLQGLSQFLTGVFSRDWREAWAGLGQAVTGGLKTPLNGMIAMINSFLAGLTQAVNAVIAGLNQLNFKLPDWIPGVGGKGFGLKLTPMQTPRIPYLAQGAVLPANKPFLAVVGDQKNGTNIEAPLDTIRQALSEVMAAQSGDITVNFTGDLAQLARVLNPVIQREGRRTGGALVKGA